MYRCIKLCRDLYRDLKRRPRCRPVRRQALPDHGLARGRATIPGRRDGGPVDERNAAVRNDRPPGLPSVECDPEGPYPYGPGMYRFIKLCRDLYRDLKRRPPFRPVRRQALPDRGLARGRATIPGRRNRGPVDERNAAVRNDRPPGSRVGTREGDHSWSPRSWTC
jgi:hypothetical protein